MNGIKFVWNVQENNKYSSSTLTSLDSNPFGIGLSNKFFLRLNSTKIQTNNQANNQWNNQTNNQSNVSYNNQWNTNNRNNNNNNNNNNEQQEEHEQHTLTLLSFQLSPNCLYMIIHVELYCHEINEQYSIIWNMNNQTSSIQNGQRTDPYPNGNNTFNYNNNNNQFPISVHYNNNNNNPAQNEGINFLRINWKLYDGDIGNYLSTKTGLTFECKLNVLKVVPNKNISYNNQVNTNDIDFIEEYDYESIEYENYDKMRFSWNINDKYMIKKLINNTDGISYHSDIYYDLFQLKVCKKSWGIQWMVQLVGLPSSTNSIGVKWDIFAIYKENKIKIISQIITFSYHTAVYNFSNQQNKILTKLLTTNNELILFCKANIIQKYAKKNKNKKNNILQQQQQQQQQMMQQQQPMVHNEINHPLPDDDELNDNNDVKEDDDDDDNDKNDKLSKQILSSQLKIVKGEKDTFIWQITDKMVLNKLKNNRYYGRIISDAFELFEDKYKFYIQLQLINNNGTIQQQQSNWSFNNNFNANNQSQNNGKDIRKIAINLICLSGNNSMSLTCKVSICILQTDTKYEKFQRFGNYNGFIQNGQPNYWEINKSKIKKLNKLTIKIDIELIDCNKNKNYNRNQFVNYSPNGIPIMLPLENDDENDDDHDDKNNKKIKLNKEVKSWLCDTVKLKQYEQHFILNGIDDLDIIKSLKIDDLKQMAIIKVGHQIKLLNAIKLLQN